MLKSITAIQRLSQFVWLISVKNAPLTLFTLLISGSITLFPIIRYFSDSSIANNQSQEKSLTEYVEFVKGLFFDVYYAESKEPRIPAESVSNFISSKTVTTLKSLKNFEKKEELLDFLKQAKIGFLPSSDPLHLDFKTQDIPKEYIEGIKHTSECSSTYPNNPEPKQPNSRSEIPDPERKKQPKLNNPCLLTGINLSEINLNNQNLSYVVLKKANLRRTQFNSAILQNANLMDTYLNKASLNKAWLVGANLTNADLRGVKMIGANLGNAILNNAQLESNIVDYKPDEITDLTRSDLSKTNLIKANLKGVILKSVILKGADLSWADLRDANLRDADLRCYKLSEYEVSEYEVSKPKSSKAFVCANLRGADLRGADLRDADLRGADLSWANLRGADLRDADLKNSRLDNIDLTQSNLRGAKLYVSERKYSKKDYIFPELSQSTSFYNSYPSKNEIESYKSYSPFYNYELSFYNDEIELYKKAKEKLSSNAVLCQTILPSGELAEPNCKPKPQNGI